jgi:hypothetical protein
MNKLYYKQNRYSCEYLLKKDDRANGMYFEIDEDSRKKVTVNLDASFPRAHSPEYWKPAPPPGHEHYLISSIMEANEIAYE